jgi:hypothetical protein
MKYSRSQAVDLGWYGGGPLALRNPLFQHKLLIDRKVAGTRTFGCVRPARVFREGAENGTRVGRGPQTCHGWQLKLLIDKDIVDIVA